MALPMDLDIKIDTQDSKIFVLIQKQECVLNFRIKNHDILEFYRTFVPENLSGKGIAARLVEYGLNYAREHNKKVIPSCSYVSSYINKHPEWASIIL